MLKKLKPIPFKGFLLVSTLYIPKAPVTRALGVFFVELFFDVSGLFG